MNILKFSIACRKKNILFLVVGGNLFRLDASIGEGFGRSVVDADTTSAARLDDGRVDLVKAFLLWDASAP